MSILKGILHHWNKTTSAYDTIHPETEYAQVTDWNKGIVNTLASTGLSSLVNVLSSNSLLALLIKKVFDATGVKYSLGQNGYVCFGSLVGGLIIQWGKGVVENGKNFLSWTYPISFTQNPFAAWLTHQNTTSVVKLAALNLPDATRLQVYTDGKATSDTQYYFFVLGI